MLDAGEEIADQDATIAGHVLEAGRAVVLSSHIMGEVEKVVDRIGVIAHGKLVAEGTLREVLAAANATSLDDAFLALTA